MVSHQSSNHSTVSSPSANNGANQFGLNYVTTNRFYIEMEKEIKACFTECQGLGVKVKREAYFEGGVNDQQRIVLGQAEYTDVTLKRGVTDNLAFLDWMSQILPELIARETGNGTPPRMERHTRRNVNILVFNQAGETMQCWTLVGAVPVIWKAPALQANGNAIAIEELTLAYEGLKVSKLGSSKGAILHTGGQGRTGNGALGRDNLGYF